MKRTTLLLIFLSAVCVNAEWKFDNDKDVQEKGDKRDEEREEARKALDRVRFGVKVGGFFGGSAISSSEDVDGSSGDIETSGLDIGIMINTLLSRLKNGNLVLATELNYGDRTVWWYGDYRFFETYLNIPLMFQYVSFFYPTTDIQVHWVPSPKRHFYMHLKTIVEAGAFIDIPLITEIDDGRDSEKYKDRNFFDLGGMVGYAAQLENIILGLRLAASYVDFGGSSLLLQGKLYFGYLF